MKRLIDVTLSLLALIVISPAVLVICLLLKLTGEGEIFYLQPRIGKNEQEFHLMKFATMLKDSPNMPGGEITVKRDPRVLPMGNFLRKTKINELPQLINILKGDMSIVGPRPLTKKHYDLYSSHTKQAIKLVRPGLTGIGSIIFRDEETLFTNLKTDRLTFYKEKIAPYKGELAAWYVDNQSLFLDLKIILLTGVSVLKSSSRLHFEWLKDLPKKNRI